MRWKIHRCSRPMGQIIRRIFFSILPGRLEERRQKNKAERRNRHLHPRNNKDLVLVRDQGSIPQPLLLHPYHPCYPLLVHPQICRIECDKPVNDHSECWTRLNPSKNDIFDTIPSKNHYAHQRFWKKLILAVSQKSPQSPIHLFSTNRRYPMQAKQIFPWYELHPPISWLHLPPSRWYPCLQ